MEKEVQYKVYNDLNRLRLATPLISSVKEILLDEAGVSEKELENFTLNKRHSRFFNKWRVEKGMI